MVPTSCMRSTSRPARPSRRTRNGTIGPEVRGRIPLQAIVKWRINTPAGFEGGTKIHINTIDPWTLRDRVRVGIETGLAGGLVADTVQLTGAVGGGP